MAKILVIDDDFQLRSMLGRFLTRVGHEVIDARDGQEGVELFEKASPDLVITDLIMPGKEGIETILEIRHLQPSARIIAISGGGRASPSSYLKLAEGLGALRVFSKPFEMADLEKAISELLSG